MTIEERAEAISFFETMLELESSIKDANFRYSKLALEALQKEPCDDVVSRQAVIDKMKERDEELSCLTVKDVRELSSVNPQQKMGRWAILKDEYGDVVNAVCSCCDKSGNHKWAFCPWCGQPKMQEVEE